MSDVVDNLDNYAQMVAELVAVKDDIFALRKQSKNAAQNIKDMLTSVTTSLEQAGNLAEDLQTLQADVGQIQNDTNTQKNQIVYLLTIIQNLESSFEELRNRASAGARAIEGLKPNGRDLANFIFAQMKQHYAETPLGEDDYEVRITRGFTLSQGQPVVVPNGQAVRPYANAVTPKSETKKHVFGGFKRCCAQLQKFDSDPERAFAALLEGDASVEKWVKPARAQFQIEYRLGDAYEPDFVVESKDAILICEIKAQNEVDNPTVIAKAQAAVKWCKAASQHAAEHKAKPWSYLLIPDDKVMGSATLDGLKARFVR